jgi:hypothetical protein
MGQYIALYRTCIRDLIGDLSKIISFLLKHSTLLGWLVVVANRFMVFKGGGGKRLSPMKGNIMDLTDLFQLSNPS